MGLGTASQGNNILFFMGTPEGSQHGRIGVIHSEIDTHAPGLLHPAGKLFGERFGTEIGIPSDLVSQPFLHDPLAYLEGMIFRNVELTVAGMEVINPLAIEVAQFLRNQAWISQAHPLSFGDGVGAVSTSLIAASLAFNPHHPSFPEITVRRGT